MSTMTEIEKEIIEEFEFIAEPMDRYELIIDMGKQLEPLNEQYKTDDFLVKGCQSKVWLYSYEEDGRVYFAADSNTVITKGIIALLIRVLSGQKAEDILSNDLSFLNEIDLRSHLSSQRSNGLTAMIQRMKNDASLLSVKAS